MKNLVCLECGKGFRRRTGKYCSRQCSDKNTLIKSGQRISKSTEFKRKHTPKHAGKPRPNLSGSNHWNWKGGVSKRPNCTFLVKQWRKEVLERKGRECSECGKATIRTIVHHVKGWYEYPDLRYDPDNGVVFCNSCHAVHHNLVRARDSLGRFLPTQGGGSHSPQA